MFYNKHILRKMILGSFLGTFMALSFWIIGYANISKPPIASIIGQTAIIFIAIFSSIFLSCFEVIFVSSTNALTYCS